MELNYYLIIVMIIIIIILLSTHKIKEGFYHYYNHKYCSTCGNKSIRNCSNCINCGLCTRPDGLIECVSGDDYGPYFHRDCYNYNTGYNIPYYYDYYGNPYKGHRFDGYWNYRMNRRGRKKRE